jgi:two-component system sensor histidine kinase KdpD
MDSHRPDPEVILDRLKAEQKTRLTMFLGACPGVGKTFAMLQSAHERVEEGVDLVIGWADTHGRKETDRSARRPGVPAERQGEL